MTETKEYSAMLYALADEIRSEEGCVTKPAYRVDEAAARLDSQTLTIRWLEIQREELLVALNKLARLGNGDEYGNSIGNRIAQDVIARVNGKAS